MQRAPLRLVGRTAVSLARHSSLSVSLFRLSFVPVSRVASIQSVRYAHGAAHLKPHVRDLETESAEVESDRDESGSGEHLEGNVPYTQLMPHVTFETYQALTHRPMKLKTMTAVQSAVFSFMPGLAAPSATYDPSPEAQAGRKDLLIQAKTGTGKTLAFLVPAIEQRMKQLEVIRKRAEADNSGATDAKHIVQRAVRGFAREHVGTVIISPTRELATQIANEAIRAATHQPEFEVRLFVGGMSKGQQMREWMRGRRDIVVATPGRLLDLIHSEPEVASGIAKAQVLILDEADTLLEMGFREDIDRIRAALPEAPERQTFLCSATVSTAIRQVTRTFLRPDHEYINAITEDSSPVHAHVHQYHTVLPSATEQLPHVMRLIAHDQMLNGGKSKVIVFLSTTKGTQLASTIVRELARRNLPADRTNVYELHSKRAQDSRTTTSEAFRRDTSGASVLVTSDVSARGVDYPGVTRVIQVGIPSTSEIYIHRVGRTGRAGTEGRGDLVLLPWELGFVTWQLTDVPMKPLTSDELKRQVKELGEDFEQNPTKYITRPKIQQQQQPPQRFDQRRRPTPSPASYAPGAVARVEGIDDAVDQLKSRLDEEAINETFASMLGYYISKSSELRVNKDVILEGCKTWAQEVGGLPNPPYVSQMFLEKLGYGDGRARRFDKPTRDYGSRGGSSMGRGRSRSFGSSEGSNPYDRASKDVYRTERFPRSDGPRRFSDSGDRPPRSFGSSDRPPRSFDSGDRPPRRFSDSGDRPPRRFSDSGDRPPRRSFDSGDRPPRRFDGSGDRPPRRF